VALSEILETGTRHVEPHLNTEPIFSSAVNLNHTDSFQETDLTSAESLHEASFSMHARLFLGLHFV
jgi:hypothetical protein